MPEGEEPKVAKNQAHQDQVSKLKNERLERHSATGRLGSPKKGGAGGKGSWGTYEDDIKDAQNARDDVAAERAEEKKIVED
mmetsp:Transcript_16321/g.48939  ORF Transcript_16321/g.48939 Transcript_16321/m.48939 type:complete len:81 (-) Transcript_16321:380-622(-)